MRLPLETVIENFRKSIFSISLGIIGDFDDANDVVQETLISYYKSDIEFNDESHVKAWLLRVAINKSKDIRKSFWLRNRVSMDEIRDIPFEDAESRSLMDSIMKLPKKYRVVLHLFYYEGMKTREISEILSESESSIRMRLSRARKMLKKVLEEENVF